MVSDSVFDMKYMCNIFHALLNTMKSINDKNEWGEDATQASRILVSHLPERNLSRKMVPRRQSSSAMAIQ